MAHIHGTAPKGANAGIKVIYQVKISKNSCRKFTDSVQVDVMLLKKISLLGDFTI